MKMHKTPWLALCLTVLIALTAGPAFARDYSYTRHYSGGHHYSGGKSYTRSYSRGYRGYRSHSYRRSYTGSRRYSYNRSYRGSRYMSGYHRSYRNYGSGYRRYGSGYRNYGYRRSSYDGGERLYHYGVPRTGGRYGFNVLRGGADSSNGYPGPGGNSNHQHRRDWEAHLRNVNRDIASAQAADQDTCGNYLRKSADCRNQTLAWQPWMDIAHN